MENEDIGALIKCPLTIEVPLEYLDNEPRLELFAVILTSRLIIAALDSTENGHESSEEYTKIRARPSCGSAGACRSLRLHMNAASLRLARIATNELAAFLVHPSTPSDRFVG